MAKQNIFDNQIFFDGYKKIRENQASANIVFEMPALYSLLPDLSGKHILDLGCGFGEHCMDYIKKGAERIVGIDISEKMLEIAKTENSDPKITYLLMPMEDIDSIDEKFDIVISSLAIHYVEDFKGVLAKIHNLLNDGGIFVFSQEHPFSTCHSGGDRWTRDENGNKLHLNLKNYGVEKETESVWFVDNVKRYHRMFSTIVNDLIDAGFEIERMIEPIPDDEILAKYPDHKDLFHKPDFLLVKAGKR